MSYKSHGRRKLPTVGQHPYGWFFENKSDLRTDRRVAYYGRYIDDCLAIVYASSADEATRIISEKVKYDNCVIEWQASETECQFLDMTIYKDGNNKIQHKPYSKPGNHLERVQWHSFHPELLKKGVFIGEMSRLATLCSTREHYREALDGLVSLYEQKGYPLEMLKKIRQSQTKNRWENRLTSYDSVQEKVLVLKTEFNDVWNFFDATKFGQSITSYWNRWYELALEGRLVDPQGTTENGVYFPPVSDQWGDCDDCKGEFLLKVACAPWTWTDPHTLETETLTYRWIPDIRKIGMTSRRFLVSKKRVTNLYDVTRTWYKTIDNLVNEELTTQDMDVDPPSFLQEEVDDIPMDVDEATPYEMATGHSQHLRSPRRSELAGLLGDQYL
ncbi:hypothetical protein AX16_001096 [Volvariella volvacea WC 439]|nr:hypothetical protein AX16_001096 [Volvariella volvacea WC 439]